MEGGGIIMSSVDDRIVKLSFDNTGFESGANKAIGILDKLSNALKLDGASKGISGVKDSINNFKLDGISSSVDSCSRRFGAFETFVAGIFLNLGNRAANFGTSLLKNITLKPITDGFNEYETQMRSIQTISANTGLGGKEGIAKINTALDELNTYADKTIYNFSEMTRNIGTFTAAGVDLDTSTKAIQGIANLAAVSGSTSQQASTAMYQLSQALAAGTVKLQDWNSVVNAGMGGAVFQEALKRTARAHGKAVDDIIAKTGSFRESLKEGWLTTDVLTDTLEQLSISYNEVGDDAYNAAMQKLLDSNYSKEDAEAILELAKTAEEAATMVRTWSQLWETVGEALGSGWAASWRIIVGDFNQATEFFTWASTKLSDIINQSSDARNKFLTEWAEAGGRQGVINVIANSFKALEVVISAISKAFSEVFGISGEEFADITKNFGEFTEALVITEDQASWLSDRFKTLFEIISDAFTIASEVGSSFLDVIGNISQYISPLVDKVDFYLKSIKMSDSEHRDFANDLSVLSSIFSNAGYVIYKVAGYFIDLAGNMLVAIKNANVFHHVVRIIQNVSNAINRILRPIRFAFTETFGLDKSFFDKISGGIGSFLHTIEKLTEKMIISGDAEKKLHDRFKDFFEIIKSLGGPLETVASSIGTFFKNILNDIDSYGISEAISNLFSGFDFGGMFDKLFAGASIGGAAVIFKWIKDFLGLISDIKNGKISDGIGGILDTVRESIEAWQNNLKVDTIQKLAISIGILAASLFILSKIPAPALVVSLVAVAAAMVMLIVAMKKMPDSGKLASSSVALIAIGVAIGLLSVSLKLLSTIDLGSMVIALGGLIATLIAVMVALNNMPDSGKLLSSSVALIAIGVAIGLLSVSLKLLSTIDLGSMVIALGGLIATLIAVMVALNNMPDSGKLLSSSVALIAIGVAIGLLSVSLKLLSTIDLGSMVIALGGLIATLIAVMVALNNMPDSGKLLSSSVALIAIGVAIGLLSVSLKLLSTIDLGSMVIALGGLIATLIAVMVALNNMPDSGKLLSSSVALIAIGVAIGLLSASLKLLSTIDGHALADSLLAVIIVLVSFVGTMALLSGLSGSMIGISVAMIALGIAIGLLAASLKLLSTIPAESLASSLLGLIVVFVSLAGTMALLSGLAAPTLLFTASMIGLAIAALLLAHALAVLVPAISPVVSAMAELGGNIIQGLIKGYTEHIAALFELAGKIFDAIVGGLKQLFGIASPSTVMAEIGGNVVQGLINGIGEFLGSLGEKALEIGTTVLNGVTELPGKLAEKAGEGMSWFVNGIGGFFGAASQKGTEIATSVGDGVAALAGNLRTKASDGMNALVSAIQSKMGTAKSKAEAVKTSVVNGFNTLASGMRTKASEGVNAFVGAISNGASRASSAASSLCQAAKNGLSNLWSSFHSVGSDAVSGFISGLTSRVGQIASAAANMVSTAINAARAKADSHSPSRVFIGIGGDIGDGFVIGIKNSIPAVSKASESMAGAVPEAFSDGLRAMSFDMDDLIETDYNPVITPVIDPTSFNSDLSMLSSAMNGRFTDLSIGNLNYTGELSAKISDANALNRQAIETIAKNGLDYDRLGVSVANALISSGVYVRMDGGQMVGYLAGELRDARRQYVR